MMEVAGGSAEVASRLREQWSHLGTLAVELLRIATVTSPELLSQLCAQVAQLERDKDALQHECAGLRSSHQATQAQARCDVHAGGADADRNGAGGQSQEGSTCAANRSQSPRGWTQPAGSNLAAAGSLAVYCKDVAACAQALSEKFARKAYAQSSAVLSARELSSEDGSDTERRSGTISDSAGSCTRGSLAGQRCSEVSIGAPNMGQSAEACEPLDDVKRVSCGEGSVGTFMKGAATELDSEALLPTIVQHEDAVAEGSSISWASEPDVEPVESPESAAEGRGCDDGRGVGPMLTLESQQAGDRSRETYAFAGCAAAPEMGTAGQIERIPELEQIVSTLKTALTTQPEPELSVRDPEPEKSMRDHWGVKVQEAQVTHWGRHSQFGIVIFNRAFELNVRLLETMHSEGDHFVSIGLVPSHITAQKLSEAHEPWYWGCFLGFHSKEVELYDGKYGSHLVCRKLPGMRGPLQQGQTIQLWNHIEGFSFGVDHCPPVQLAVHRSWQNSQLLPCLIVAADTAVMVPALLEGMPKSDIPLRLGRQHCVGAGWARQWSAGAADTIEENKDIPGQRNAMDANSTQEPGTTPEAEEMVKAITGEEETVGAAEYESSENSESQYEPVSLPEGGPWQVGNLEFFSSFESGNCAKVRMSVKSSKPSAELPWPCVDIFVRAESQAAEQVVPVVGQWFYFGVRSLCGAFQPGQRLTFQIRGLRGLRALSGAFLADGIRPVVSVVPNHAESWHFVEGQKGSFVELQGRHSAFAFEHVVRRSEGGREELYFARTFPYPLREVHRHLADLEGRLRQQGAYVHREELARSLGGRPVELLTITHAQGRGEDRMPAPTGLKLRGERPHTFPGRRLIFVSARVHPGETPASYVLEGLLDFLAEGGDSARELLHRYIVQVVPVLNPDGVELGHQRTDLRGENLNRVYPAARLADHPSIFAAKAALMAAHQSQGHLRLYLDLHAHCNTRGLFLLGDSPRAEARLFAYLLARRCSAFEYGQSNFLDSVGGTGKSWARLVTGEPLCFTLEANYCRGHHSRACFTPSTWRNIGGECLKALLELDDPEGWRPDLPPLRELLAALPQGGQPLRVEGPSRAVPRFALFGVPARCVEVVGGSERRGSARLHEHDGGLEVAWSALKFQPSQRGRFLYRAVTTVQVTLLKWDRSAQLDPIRAGTEVVVEERCVVDGKLRLKIATHPGSLWTGGWVSEYHRVLFDPRLGGDVAMMRLEDSDT